MVLVLGVLWHLVRVVVVDIVVVDDRLVVVVQFGLLDLVPDFEGEGGHVYEGCEQQLGDDDRLDHAEDGFDLQNHQGDRDDDLDDDLFDFPVHLLFLMVTPFFWKQYRIWLQVPTVQ